ncbi:hypothetical protein BKD30_00145 [Tersicoccus phoenicis]|uniref:Cell wall biosynthesis glycosyltransferase n=1 Tax=Tersicoccus phoenicis TaxID=554083 RepID=A0A1R1LQ76_9MICC|nr:DUF5998 family protein [Tersicoccus phoenicis]OMH29690.1 hypothetical protein BKD30_00145 [Tersicoccus phoenicis]
MQPTIGSAAGAARKLKKTLDHAGFYPALVLDVILDALDGREPAGDLVHLETHVERTEVHRHITVLVLTEDMLVVTQADDQHLEEDGAEPLAHVSTESVPLAAVTSVVLSAAWARPHEYRPADQPREVTLAISWSGAQRLDLVPAGCTDPQCDADHGYTGTAALEDLVLRISADADGPDAVEAARRFARSIRAASAVPGGTHPRSAPARGGVSTRLGRTQSPHPGV